MKIKEINTYRHLDIQGYEALETLALDLIWSWNHRADIIWQQIDPDLWDNTHNPWVVLQTVSKEKLEKILADNNFLKSVNDLVLAYQADAESPAWFQKNHPNSPLTCVAYFSMEFMLSEALPIYSGGLGNVAGDQLKTASDLGVPVVAIGLLYQQGYFRQVIDKEGKQQELYPYNDPGQLPIMPLRKENGEWLRLEIALPGWSVWIRAWQVQVGRVKLYLLDTNDAANNPIHRGITSELYGGDSELRLKQELILGIAGWRLLEELGINPQVCHLNEGHAAFAVLERAKSFMKKTGQPFDVALTTTRAGNLFTTHTAVPAGFDRFSPSLIEQYLTKYATEQLKISIQDLLALGRENPYDSSEKFNMAYLAVRGSGAVNGVSGLHGKVSRKIFEEIFPRWPNDEIPIGHVTNGVHMPSWDSIQSDDLWSQACGKSRWLGVTEGLEKSFQTVTDNQIWDMRNEGRKSLVEYARARVTKQLAARGEPPEEVERGKHLFDPHVLTLGFARRFATYKRPNMLLHDPDRLLRILNNATHPVQLLIAGKAHPKDLPGKALIAEWMNFIKRPEARAHVIFLSDYDMFLTEQLVRGVDIWVNTPRRPWEACGTSGMKVLVNGGLNISELDGWWAEAYCPQVGWAIGDGQEHDTDLSWDASEALSLYNVLENEIIPQFYERNLQNIPTKWVGKIRQSMGKLTPHFSANRAVRQYTEQYYIPAATKFLNRASDQGALGKKIRDWHKNIAQGWEKLGFHEIKIETKDNQHHFEVQVYLNGLNPSIVKVELFIDPSLGKSQEMTFIQKRGDYYLYQATVSSNTDKSFYTPRAIPHFIEADVPLEAPQITWQR